MHEDISEMTRFWNTKMFPKSTSKFGMNLLFSKQVCLLYLMTYNRFRVFSLEYLFWLKLLDVRHKYLYFRDSLIHLILFLVLFR